MTPGKLVFAVIFVRLDGDKLRFLGLAWAEISPYRLRASDWESR